MIRINLLPTREIHAARRKRRTVIAGAAALCFAAGALAAFNISQLRRQTVSDSELTERRQLVAGLRLDTKAVKELEGRIRRQRHRNEAVEARLQRRAHHSRVLRGLSTAAPERLWLTRYAESGDKTILEGRATDDDSITRFLRRLLPVVKDPRLVEAGQVAGDNGLRRFVIHAGTRALPDSIPREKRQRRDG
ncbi:MAG: PilN domain-containing protein [Deltaproteobacteria bacterium]|nr:PilN domain-containing protein [Deltaproteobacteria bacterium]